LAEAEIEKKKEIIAQQLTLRENELQNAKDEIKKLKKKLTVAKADLQQKNMDLEKKLLMKAEEMEDLKLQFSEGEVEKLLRNGEKKDHYIKELKNENTKLVELKNYYEKILEKYENDVQVLKKKNEELDKGEEVRNIGKQLDVLKMKMMFYEGHKEKVDLKEMGKQMEELERKLKNTQRPIQPEISVQNSITE
jgi:DNA repair exonuclease SbcCD ATPase subunit